MVDEEETYIQKRKNRNECIDRSLYHFTCSCPASLVRIKREKI